MRAKDLHMAATIDEKARTILLTGAIDQNDLTITVKVKVPSPGVWTVIKAETNLTDKAWGAWQVTLGEGCSLPPDGAGKGPVSRQFKKAEYLKGRNAILFHGGEVRPGDAVLKIFRVRVSAGILYASHNRAESQLSPGELRKVREKGFGEELPKVEVTAPVYVIRG